MAEDAECEELLQQLVSANEASLTGGLILKLEGFLKKPTIEDGLSEVLVEYLQHLRTSKIYLSSGIFTINFAECALLLQSASNLYAKKVDLLWDCIIAYQERNVLYEERSERTETEFKKVEERKERFKRKRTKKKLEGPALQEAQQIKLPNHDEMYERIWQDSSDLTDEIFFRIKEESAEPLADEDPYDDYFNNWYTYDNLTQSLNRCPLMMKDIHKIKNSRVFKRQSYYQENPLFNVPIKGVNPDGDEETLFQYSELTMNYLYKNNEEDMASLRSRMDGTEVDYKPVNAMEYCLQLFLSFYKIPIDSIYKDTEKFLLFYKDFLSTLPPAEKVVPAQIMETVKSNPKATEEEPVVDTRLDEGESDCDIGADDDTSKLNRQDPIRKTTESSDSGFFDGEGECHGCSEVDKFSSAGSVRITPINPTPLDPDFLNVTDMHNDSAVHSELKSPNVTTVEEVMAMCKPVRKRKTKEIQEDVGDEKSVLPKRSRKQLFKTRPTHTAKLKKFEAFFSSNYKSAEGEGAVIPVEYSDSEEETDSFDQTVSNETDNFDQTATDEADSCMNSTFESTQTTLTTEISPVLETSLTVIQDDNHEEDDSDEQLINYLNWKEFIEGEIKSQSQAQFDIHEEGTAIIERIGIIGSSIKYNEMCDGMNSRRVTHSFIAMLQLANTYNVEITNATGGTLANDTLELRLLSKERHHENLGEYQAPSEVTLNDRLKHAKRAALNYQSCSSGTSQQTSARIYKKIRLG